LSFSVTRLLRKVPVAEQLKEIGTFINRELLPYLHELRESLKTAFETPSDSLDLIGDTEGQILVRGANEWEVITGHKRFIRRVYLTNGTEITHHDDAVYIEIEGCGAGGAGGGAAAAIDCGGSNGGSGSYARHSFTLSSLTSTYTIGAAGTGVSGAAGNAGTSSTFTHGGVTVTCPGGSPGTLLATGIVTSAAAGGQGGTAPTISTGSVDFSIVGQPGGYVQRITDIGIFHTSGAGSTPLGLGAEGRGAAGGSSGTAGTGFGSGGTGGLNNTASTVRIGGDGKPGVWIVDEFA
jgi:hypothetical protein